MSGCRCLAVGRPPVGDCHWYFANLRSAAVPTGLSQKETIKAIWTQHHQN